MSATVTDALIAAGLGLRRGKVQVRDSRAAWSRAYELIEPMLSRTVGDLVVELQHVGSTAVAGLRAKPILDVAVGVPAAVDARPQPLVDSLVRIGFLDLGPGDGSVGRLLVWELEPGVRAMHLHVIRHGGDYWRHYVDFRDTLRADNSLREKYARLKSDLAARNGNDRRAYTGGKAEFIERVLQI